MSEPSGEAHPSPLEGIVIQKSSRDVRVDVGPEVLRCEFRGRMREREAGRVVVVGDRVAVTRLADGEGVVEIVHARRNELVRETAGREKVLVAANVDQVLIVLSAFEPAPRWALADRMLIAAERDDVVPAIALNKADQALEASGARQELRETLGIYERAGYPTFAVSAVTGEGLDRLKAWLQGKVTVFSGHSGVGKSTLLNALRPDLALGTGEVNEVTKKGRHTTTAVSLHRLPGGGHAADTPGFREFLPSDLSPSELGRHYPEFRSVFEGARCRFTDCLHRTEPACPIRKGVESGAIPQLRYQSYLQILATLLSTER